MRRHAFTLIELLVVIGVVAVLLGILAPSLARLRVSAYESKTLAQLRDLGVTIEIYLQSSRDTYPWRTPGEPYFFAPPGTMTGSISTSDDPWALRYLWPVLMHQTAPWSEHYLSWMGSRPSLGDNRLPWQGDGVGSPQYPAYEYSNSFVGDPSCWMPSGRAIARPIRQPSVRFPSAKVLMFDASRSYLPIAFLEDARRGVLLADGSAALHHDSDATSPVENRLRPSFGASIYHDTQAGVLGRDF